MLIPVTFKPNTSSAPTPNLPSALAKISNGEVILIELQGSLDVEAARPTDKNGQLVGKLTIDEGGSGKPSLLIGHHLLEGKIATLSKPLAILTRSTSGVNSSATTFSLSQVKGRGKDNSDSYEIDVDEDEGDGNGDIATASTGPIHWEAIGVVKRKIVFSNRPMPVIHLKK